MKLKVLVAHPGTQYSHQLVKQLEKQDLLYQFCTGFAIAEKSWKGRLIKLLPQKLFKKISNRIINHVPAQKIKTQAILEWKTIRRMRTGDTEQVIYERNKLFQEAIPDKAIITSDVVIGFDTSSWILIERCKKLGKKFILDVSIAHPLSKKKVYDQIATAYPGWNMSLKHKPDELIRLEQKEMNESDHIVVASSFSRNTLIENHVDGNKITVNSYGVDSGLFYPVNKNNKENKKIRFVFVGLIDARKGVPLLLEAWNAIKDHQSELTLIGPVSEESKKMIGQNFPGVIVKGKISFAELTGVLPMYDVLVFPSYFEGFGLVVLEAMSCGLPVITTDATCAPDVIDDGKNGILVQTGSTKELQLAMTSFINGTYDLSVMSRNAREKSLQYSWDSYGKRWSEIIYSMQTEDTQ